MTTTLRRIVVAFVLATVPLAAAPQADLSQRTILSERQVTLTRPLQRVKPLVEQFGALSRTPLGLEELPRIPLGPHEVVRPPRVLSTTPLAGVRLGDALNLLVDADPRYRWVALGAVINILPSEPLINDPLEQPVAAFALDGKTLSDAMTALHRLFDPGYSGPVGVVHTGIRPGAVAEAQGMKPFSVHVQQTRVRDVLNVIVAAHGEAMWFVSYVNNPAGVANMILEFRTFDGWAEGTKF